MQKNHVSISQIQNSFQNKQNTSNVKKKKNLHIQNAMYFQLKNNNKARRNVWKMLIQK